MSQIYENYIEVETINGNKFLAQGDAEGRYISTLENGYIILPEGEFVKTGQDHGASLTDFYNQYMEIPCTNEKLHTMEAIELLLKEGFVIFLGTCRNNAARFRQNDLGIGVIYFPSPEKITKQQKISCQKLIDSNTSVIDKNRERIDLKFSIIKTSITKEELMQTLNIEKTYIKK